MFFLTLFSIKAAFYVLFLAVLSFALIYGSTCQDPTQYNDSADKFRAFCEVCSVIFLMIHLFEEIDEIARYVWTWHKSVSSPAVYVIKIGTSLFITATAKSVHITTLEMRV